MPNRILKESICTSDSVDSLSWFEEVLFYRLIVNCDDYGRFDGRPAIIKNRLFPLKESLTTKAVTAAIDRLASTGMVVLYMFEGKPYLYLPTWNCHQCVRAKKSKYPAPTVEEASVSESTAVENSCSQSESICEQMISDDFKCSRNTIQSVSEPISEPENESAPAPTRTAGNSRDGGKHKRSKYGWVKLTDTEYARLIADLGEAETARCIVYVDESAQSNGNKNRWKDWNLVIRKCSREGWGKQRYGKNTKLSAEEREEHYSRDFASDFANLEKLINKI